MIFFFPYSQPQISQVWPSLSFPANRPAGSAQVFVWTWYGEKWCGHAKIQYTFSIGKKGDQEGGYSSTNFGPYAWPSWRKSWGHFVILKIQPMNKYEFIIIHVQKIYSLKFVLSEKHTKICKISLMLFTFTL